MAQEQVPEPRKAGEPTGRQRSRLVRAIALGTGVGVLLASPIVLFGAGDASVVCYLMLTLLFCLALGGRGPSHLRVRR